MIKRQFYKQDHDNDKDDISDSSSDSESEEVVSEAQEEEEQEEDEDSDVVAEAKEDEQLSSLSTGSGYNSEESSADEVDFDSPGSLLDDDEEEEISKDNIKDSQSMSKKRKFESVKNANSAPKDPIDAVFAMRTLNCGSVLKCRLCPRIVCLSGETMKAHLTSKRHARSEKLLTEGRLKFMLNSDGEAEEEPETHAERHARTLAIAQDLTGKGSCPSSKKKNRGRQRQRDRKRKETGDAPDKRKKKSVKKQDERKEKQSVKKQDKETKQSVKTQDKEIEKQSVETQAKKRRKNKD